ncbi:MAG TPA: heavy metal translocating P-type ATPase, partial [Paracoccus solventivorans]
MQHPRQIELQLEGLSCASCVGRAERALAAVPGVAAASVNLATRRARLELDDAAALAPAIEAVGRAGYPAALDSTRLAVEGMTCASCTGRVERALLALPGVTAAVANLATRSVTVTHAPGISPQALAGTVTRAGYKASVPEDAPDAPPPEDEAGAMRRRMILAAALTLPVFITEMGGHAYPPFHHWLMSMVGTQPLWILQFLLTLAVLAGPGRIFFTIGIPALLRGAPEMNSLVAMGAGAAFLYSTVATFAPGVLPPDGVHVYFEAAAVIVTLILLGRWLEARARGRAGQAIRRLVELAPATARVIRGGQPVEVAVAELVPGDLVQLLPGGRVAVDGELVEGEGAIDESMLTGEPLPVAKAPGDPVTGGTVNGASALVYRVTATGADTALARIVRMVEDAQAAKLPVQGLVDRVTRVFVPVVIALAVLSFAVWLALGAGLAVALVSGISVLIIACPCAMGLAVPVSIMVGTGRGAELGILFRRGDALQRLADARVVGFDKTGTLTMGRPALVALEVAGGVAEDELLRLAASAEAQSEHPLAAAVIEAARARGIAPAAASGVS